MNNVRMMEDILEHAEMNEQTKAILNVLLMHVKTELEMYDKWTDKLNRIIEGQKSEIEFQKRRADILTAELLEIEKKRK